MNGVSLSGFAVLILLVLLPRQSAEGALTGLLACGQRVIPSLFPFFVVCSLLTSVPAAAFLCRPFQKLLRLRSPQAGTALLLGWLGGFAAAAVAVSDLYQKERMDRRDARIVLACTVGAGPAFVVNTVGLGLLHSQAAGACLLAALWLANLSCGLLLSRLWPPEHSAFPEPVRCPGKISLPQAVDTAVRASLTVCGFVVFFSALSACLEVCLPLRGESLWLLRAVLEVTSGCLTASETARPLAACCAGLSLLSLSVYLQVKALLPPTLSPSFLLWLRPLHLILSLSFLHLLGRLIPDSVQVYSTLCQQIIPKNRLEPDTAFVLFVLCCTVLHFTSGREWSIIKQKPVQ